MTVGVGWQVESEGRVKCRRVCEVGMWVGPYER